MRIMLVEDQALIRMGIKMSLSSQSEIEIVNNSENGLMAVKNYLETKPDVVLMDIRMPVMNGLEASRKIKELDRNAKIIFLTSHDAVEDVFEAFAIGANGYCLKDIEPPALIESLKAAQSGNLSIDTRIANKMLHFIASKDALPNSPGDKFSAARLNERDQDVLHQLINGLTSEEMTIATKLSVINILNKILLLQDHTVNQSAPAATDMTILSKFEFVEDLGAGAMGQVFKARQKQSGELVAIKTLRSQNDASWQRLIREATIMSELTHPGIVKIFDFLLDKDRIAYLVMELVDGPNLSDVIECGGAIIEKEALPIFIQCLDALQYLHSHKIIHRDIKPSNIIVYCQDEEKIQVKLADFGIAKQNENQQRLTMQGEVFGSPLYMSPEQCRAEKLEAGSDIYSFGCVMFELLNGFPPFLGNTYLETMSMHLLAPLPSLDSWADRNVSTELKTIVTKCLAKNPTERFQTAQELLELLQVLA